MEEKSMTPNTEDRRGGVRDETWDDRQPTKTVKE